MGGCRCSYRNCRSATKLSENLHFFHYPVKHNERCKQWILNANKSNFFNLSEDQLRNKVVCELHFEDRCFSNSQKKRLLHDAIPTLDGDSQDEEQLETYQSQHSFEDVQVLPANADGTIFMVDTDSMQQLPESKIETYILRDGSVVPLYKNNIQNDNSQVIYTDTTLSSLESMKVEAKNFMNSVPANYFQKSGEEELQIIYNDKSYIASDNVDLNFLTSRNADATPVISEDSMNYSYVPEPNPNLSPKINNNKKQATPNSKQKNKYMYRRIKQHSKEIAKIKKILQNNIVMKRFTRRSILNYLKNRIPPTLLSIVDMNINTLSPAGIKEIDFFKNIKSTSPELYNLLREKYKWNLPEVQDVNDSI